MKRGWESKKVSACSWVMTAAVLRWAIQTLFLRKCFPRPLPTQVSHTYSPFNQPMALQTHFYGLTMRSAPQYTSPQPNLIVSVAYILRLWIRGSFMTTYFSVQIPFKKKDRTLPDFILWKHFKLPKCDRKQAQGFLYNMTVITFKRCPFSKKGISSPGRIQGCHR